MVVLVLRERGQNLSNRVGATLTFLAVGGIALVVLVLTQPLRRAARAGDHAAYGWLAEGSSLRRLDADTRMLRPALVAVAVALGRSEEHTSEFQSRENLVCRLLLEKKKKCVMGEHLIRKYITATAADKQKGI